MNRGTVELASDTLQRHLSRALEVDDPSRKNYHIRSALQAKLIIDDLS